MITMAVAILILQLVIGLFNIEICETANVALTARGAQCSASSEIHTETYGTFNCERALDGIAAPGWHEWATDNQGVGAWIEIGLLDIYEVHLIRLMQRVARNERFRELLLQFDGNRELKVVLSDDGSADWLNFVGTRWEEFPISHICSRKVRIEALTVFTAVNNGFMEVEVHSDRMCLNRNIALSSQGASCSTSSEFNGHHGCEKTIDGISLGYPYEWASLGEGAGAWILITFNSMYDLRRARFMQRPGSGEQFRDIELLFDGHGDLKQEFTLTPRNGTNALDALWWDEFDLEPVCSNNVKVTFLTEYTRTNNGLLEVEFYATDQVCGCAN